MTTMTILKMMMMLMMIETTLAWPMPEIKTAGMIVANYIPKNQGENGRSVQRCWIYNRFWGGNSISFAQVKFTEYLLK